MKQSFTPNRKRTIDIYNISLVVYIFLLALIIMDIIINKYSSIQIPNIIISLAIFALIDVIFIAIFAFMKSKKDYSTFVDFSPAGIGCVSKGIFMRWEDVANIEIKLIGTEPYFIISSVKGKLPFFSKHLFWKMTPEHIIVECRKELVPVIEQYWPEPIKKIKRCGKGYTHLNLLLIVFLFIIIALLWLLFLLYALVYLPEVLAT